MFDEIFAEAVKTTGRAVQDLKRLQSEAKPAVMIRPHHRWGKNVQEAKELHDNPDLVKAVAISEAAFKPFE